MPRRARIIVPGVAHHVTQRGNNRQQVFCSDEDRRLYLDLLTRYARRYGTQIAGYCLMTNHVHLVVVPEHKNSLARTFGQTHAEYALALNVSAKRSGHLWQNRFFSCPLDAAHWENALRYVELNPVRAGLALSGIGQAECDSIRRATHTGEPLGSREFVRQLERQAGRRLQVLARGRPAKRPCQPDRTGLQQDLFGVEA